jgi:NNP family nitrate/nitrite transporter-like MFS transporter
MSSDLRATRICLTDFTSAPMRAFHITWMSFFLCFFAWFGAAPLMGLIREEFHLSKSQVGWCVIASVAATVVARIFIGWSCDRFGPRRSYSALLIVGSLPVMLVGLSHDFTSFLIFRVLIGMIGASFIVTQYHTSLMFAPNCIGAANATTAGWGNLGGGVTQFAMPMFVTFLVGSCGLTTALGWRVAMLTVGALCMLVGIAYYFLTQDTPEGNFPQHRPKYPTKGAGGLLQAARDPRVLIMASAYACCFGMELTLDNIAALYFSDNFELGIEQAGFAAAAFGMMNLFARTLGGWISDRTAVRWGIQGRALWLTCALLGEGVLLAVFSRCTTLWVAIAALMTCGLFVKMSNGAVYSVVPFLKRQKLGAVAGLVGAGGNVGAMAAGFLFKGSLAWSTSLLILGFCVIGGGLLTALLPLFGLDEAQDSRPVETKLPATDGLVTGTA